MAFRHVAVAAVVASQLVWTIGCGGGQSASPRVVHDEGSLVILDDTDESIPVRIQFEFDSHVLRESAHAPLDALAEYLIANEDYELVEVQGHSDERGDEAHNRALSRRRAEAVVDYLVGEGVEGERLRAEGYGSSRPAVQGSGERVWSHNRRVEFVIVHHAGET